MKLNKSTLKKLIKESLDEMSLHVPAQQDMELVDRVTRGMIESAVSGAEDYLITRQFATKILAQHHIDNLDEAFAELGDNEIYKVSELFGWLGY
jgi:hypothetical protein